MILYSHVSLLISCDAGNAATITELLGVQPTLVRESKTMGQSEDGSWQESTHYTWTLHSPKSHTDGDPTARLHALADLIEPFASRLPRLHPQFSPSIDIIYHITPQHPDGVTGEFDWFQMPADLMRRYGAWDLNVSYESFWFDHPDWIPPQPQAWWRRILESLHRRKQHSHHGIPPT